MLTVLESINLSAEYLEKKGIESSRTNAELLLADILDCKRLDLYLKYDRPLSDDEKKIYREYISRRGKFEPLQYILGYVEFYGLKFFVNPDVLIPRPETEILVETIINRHDKNAELKILDIGTGSGNIPITLAKHFPDSTVVSIDISSAALEVARKNSELNETVEACEFKLTNILEMNTEEIIGDFDIIVSNPPYVSLKEFETLQKEIIHFEPQKAVTDNGDGLKFYEHITQLAKDLLTENGTLYFELGKGQVENVMGYFKKQEYKNITSVKDYLNIDRVIFGDNS